MKLSDYLNDLHKNELVHIRIPSENLDFIGKVKKAIKFADEHNVTNKEISHILPEFIPVRFRIALQRAEQIVCE